MLQDLFDLVENVQEVSAPTLTVREQARLKDNLPELRWHVFFPRTNADSIRIADFTTVDFRPVADRRPWGGRGRLIPLRHGKLSELEMSPIEAYYIWNEYEMQRLMERNAQKIELALQATRARIPERAEALADADYRRVEIDAFHAWRTGEIVVKDPETEQALTLTLELAQSERRQAATTPWTASTAYEEFLAVLYDALQYLGTVRGAVVRRSTLNAIIASAPVAPLTGFRITKGELEARIQQEIGSDFTFRVEERSVDVFTGRGTQTALVKIWDGTEIAFIPGGAGDGGVSPIGQTHFAPVLRAQMMAEKIGHGYIDVRGVTLFYVPSRDGKQLEMQAQLNALPVPDERRLFVFDPGI